MRELTKRELEEVNGGFGLPGAVLGAVTGGAIAAGRGAGWGGIATGVILGGVSGFFGGISAATTGLSRYMFGAYSVEVAYINDRATSGHTSS
jgi:uncharacterized membrane protein